MSEIRSTETEKIIKAIQDIAIILTGAAEFVCRRRMLKRFSEYLEESLKKLEGNIAVVKKQLPGKMPDSFKLDKSLRIIRDVALILREDDGDTEARCRSGELGAKLSFGVAELKAAIRTIFDALTGNLSRYSILDRCSEYGGRIKSFLLRLSPVVSNTGRIFLAASLLFIFLFVYLALTMETEDALLRDIKRDLVFVKEQKELLERQRKEYRKIKEKIWYFDQTDMDREDKIQWLNLSLEERRSRELIDQTKLSIEKAEEDIAEKNMEVEKIRKKSFFQKLLRK